MKECYTCKIEKRLSDFHIRKSSTDGHRGNCKECRNREYLSNPEPAKIRAKKCYYSNYKHSRKMRKEWEEENKDKMNGYKQKWREEHEKQRLAHYAVSNALKSGKIIKEKCKICGNKKTHAHHDDYSKRLSVVWLCSKHHTERRKKI